MNRLMKPHDVCKVHSINIPADVLH